MIFRNEDKSRNVGLREALSYFSIGTLTSSSFGDIVAIHPIARSLVNLESICGQLFPATMVAQLVAMYRFRKQA